MPTIKREVKTTKVNNFGQCPGGYTGAVGSGVFILLFLGGWNPLPWVPLSTLVGWLAAPSMLARASGPFLASVLWSVAGGYDSVLLALAACAAAAALAFYLATARLR